KSRTDLQTRVLVRASRTRTVRDLRRTTAQSTWRPQSPLHETRCQPCAKRLLSTTLVPIGKLAEHCRGQSIPAGLLRMDPRPSSAMRTARSSIGVAMAPSFVGRSALALHKAAVAATAAAKTTRRRDRIASRLLLGQAAVMQGRGLLRADDLDEPAPV